MINDFALEVATNQAPTSIATHVSASSIDLSSAASAGGGLTVGANGISIGTGYPLYMVVDVTTAVTSGGTATVAFGIITSPNADLSGTPKTVGLSKSYSLAELNIDTATKVKFPIAVAINPDIGNIQGLNQQYLGATIVIADAVLTAGAFTIGFQLSFQNARVFQASTSS